MSYFGPIINSRIPVLNSTSKYHMLVDMRLNVLFEVPPAFLSGVTGVFKFSFRAGRHIIDVVLAEILSLQSQERKSPIPDPLCWLYIQTSVLVSH